jgi:hypothetical protein
MSDAEDTPAKGSKRPRVAGPMAPIAQPMSGKKLHKKLYKVVKKGERCRAGGTAKGGCQEVHSPRFGIVGEVSRARRPRALRTARARERRRPS